MSISALAAGEKSEDHLAQVTKFIPTEIVAIYVAIAAIWDPVKVGKDADGKDLPIDSFDFTSRWWLFFAMVAFTPVMTYFIFSFRVRSAKGPIKFDGWKWLSASIYGMLGLTAWATALADTPWLGFTWWKPAISIAVLLVFTLLVPYFPRADVLDDYADVQNKEDAGA